MSVRPLFGVLLVASALVLTGCGKEKPIVDPISAFSTPPPASPTATASPKPSVNPLVPTVSLAKPLNVPDVTRARFIQTADAGNGALDNGAISSDRLNTIVRVPCATAAPKSDSGVTERAGYSVAYRFSDLKQTPDGEVGEIISRYASPAQATAYVTELTAAVAACPRQTVTGSEWTTDIAVVGSGFVADSSLMISMKHSGPDQRAPGKTLTYTVYRLVIRGGATVVILDVAGWEGTTADGGDMQRLLQAALNRATA